MRIARDRNARDLAQLIEDLLESSRLLTGKVRLASNPSTCGGRDGSVETVS